MRVISPKLFMPCMMMPPKLVLPKLVVMVLISFSLPQSRGSDGLAAAGTDDIAMLIEEHIVVDHEETFTLDEFVQRAGVQGDGVARPCRLVVTPRLAGIDGAWRPHPVVRRGAGKHQKDVD